jgi:hypothetical protein
VAVSGSAVPRQVTLHGATQVQAMVAALCALPAMPPGQHCPAASADSGSVRLVFAAGEQSFPPVSVQESDCHGVTGLGATRSWSPSSAFGRMLSEAVGGLGRLVPGTHPSSVPTGPRPGWTVLGWTVLGWAGTCSQVARTPPGSTHQGYGMPANGPLTTRIGRGSSGSRC